MCCTYKASKHAFEQPSRFLHITHIVNAPLNLFQFDDSDFRDVYNEPIFFVASRPSDVLRCIGLSVQLTRDMRVRTATFNEECLFA